MSFQSFFIEARQFGSGVLEDLSVMRKVFLVLGWLAAFLMQYLGSMTAYRTLLFLMVLDVVTRTWAIGRENGGLVQALKTQAWQSTVLRQRGMVKLLGYTVFIMVGHAVGSGLPQYGQYGLGAAFYGLLFLVEGMSNLENLVDCGFTQFQPMLAFLRKKKEEVANVQGHSGALGDTGDRVGDEEGANFGSFRRHISPR